MASMQVPVERLKSSVSNTLLGLTTVHSTDESDELKMVFIQAINFPIFKASPIQ